LENIFAFVSTMMTPYGARPVASAKDFLFGSLFRGENGFVLHRRNSVFFMATRLPRLLRLRLWAWPALVLTLLPAGRAATVWNGPTITFTKANNADPNLPANQDRITANTWITRGDVRGLYNAARETGFTHYFSPSNTAWANGTLANYASLPYTNWNYWAAGVNGGPHGTVGKDAVVHLIAEDIYLSVKVTSWTGPGGGFSYVRSTAPPPTPTVTLTSPTDGSVFAAPASFALTADASVSGGTVTNVEYFAGTTSLGRAMVSPFNVTGSNMAAGPYQLTAVATASGVSATSAPVTINVVTPVAVNMSAPAVSGNGPFSLSYSANPGLRYVIETTLTLTNPGPQNWTALATNVASSNPQTFTTPTTNGRAFYRVGRLTN
jgi:hypothetical protein